LASALAVGIRDASSATLATFQLEKIVGSVQMILGSINYMPMKNHINRTVGLPELE